MNGVASMDIINTNNSIRKFNDLKSFVMLLLELAFIICVILFDEHNMVKICYSFLAIIRFLLEKSFTKYKNEYNVFYITVIYCYFIHYNNSDDVKAYKRWRKWTKAKEEKNQ